MNLKKNKQSNKGNNVVSGADNGADGSSNDKKKTCYHCDEPGPNYPKRKNNSQVVVVEGQPTESYNSEEELALVSSPRYGDLSDIWVFDLGCSFYMCPSWEWFDTYKDCNKGILIVGNNAPCKMMGIRSMRLKEADKRKIT